jgi:hypothetical protein
MSYKVLLPRLHWLGKSYFKIRASLLAGFVLHQPNGFVVIPKLLSPLSASSVTMTDLAYVRTGADSRGPNSVYVIVCRHRSRNNQGVTLNRRRF